MDADDLGIELDGNECGVCKSGFFFGPEGGGFSFEARNRFPEVLPELLHARTSTLANDRSRFLPNDDWELDLVPRPRAKAQGLLTEDRLEDPSVDQLDVVQGQGNVSEALKRSQGGYTTKLLCDPRPGFFGIESWGAVILGFRALLEPGKRSASSRYGWLDQLLLFGIEFV